MPKNATKTTTSAGDSAGSKKFILTAEQQAIVQTSDRYAQVSAYAGTAKTTVLTHRVGELIRRGAAPQDILVVSFSKAAVKEAKRRMPAGVHAMTMHALGLRLLSAGESAGAPLIQEKAALKLWGQALKNEERAIRQERKKAKKKPGMIVDYLRDIRKSPAALKKLASFVEVVRASGGDAWSLLKDPRSPFNRFREQRHVLKEVAKRYGKLKREAGLLDYADLISGAKKKLDGMKGLWFKHLLVDEYQDCTPAQTQLLIALASRLESLMVVGDRFQTIYGFAGASFTDLSLRIPGVRQYPLTTSFRLTEPNARFATALLRQADPDALALVSGTGPGRRPRYTVCASPAEQEQQVIQLLQRLTEQDVNLGDVAILGRTREQLRGIEQALLSKGLDADPIYRSRDVRHPLEALRLVRKLDKLAKKHEGRVLRQALRDLLRGMAGDKEVPDTTLERYRRRLEQAAACSLETRYNACGFVYRALRDFGREKDADAEASINRWVASASAFHNAKQLRDHIREISAQAKVQTVTVHQAKGREWDHVIVLSVVDGVYPFFRDRTVASQEAALNLLYVACTRAEERLYLFQAPYANARSRKRFDEPSRFLTCPAVCATLKLVDAT